MITKPLKAGVIGATGYTGVELIRLIHAHPRLDLEWVAASERNSGKALGAVLPSLYGVEGVGDLKLDTFSPGEIESLTERLDVLFCCLPHQQSANIIKQLSQSELSVVDLSADFRIKNQADYEAWYGPHPAPELLPRAVYGLPELHRGELEGARLIAAPGCYPTCALLALAPLFKAQLTQPQETVIIDAKSGVSGAGRNASQTTHFPELSEGLRPYKVAGTHRHTVEIEQELSRLAEQQVRVLFTPHLVPMTRGILSVAYVRLAAGVSLGDCFEAAHALYPQGNSPGALGSGLVSILPEEQLPDTLWVRGSARAHITYRFDPRTNYLIAISSIDNLNRGAAGQAIQAFNVSRGWPDALGLPTIAQFP